MSQESLTKTIYITRQMTRDILFCLREIRTIVFGKMGTKNSNQYILRVDFVSVLTMITFISLHHHSTAS